MLCYAQVQELQLAPAIFFSELAPRAFERLRTSVFHTSNDDYVASIWGDTGGPEEDGSTQKVVERMVLNFSEGKGGGFFFWSLDRRFMVKTLEAEEYVLLKKVLP